MRGTYFVCALCLVGASATIEDESVMIQRSAVSPEQENSHQSKVLLERGGAEAEVTFLDGNEGIPPAPAPEGLVGVNEKGEWLTNERLPTWITYGAEAWAKQGRRSRFSRSSAASDWAQPVDGNNEGVEFSEPDHGGSRTAWASAVNDHMSRQRALKEKADAPARAQEIKNQAARTAAEAWSHAEVGPAWHKAKAAKAKAARIAAEKEAKVPEKGPAAHDLRVSAPVERQAMKTDSSRAESSAKTDAYAQSTSEFMAEAKLESEIQSFDAMRSSSEVSQKAVQPKHHHQHHSRPHHKGAIDFDAAWKMVEDTARKVPRWNEINWQFDHPTLTWQVVLPEKYELRMAAEFPPDAAPPAQEKHHPCTQEKCTQQEMRLRPNALTLTGEAELKDCCFEYPHLPPYQVAEGFFMPSGHNVNSGDLEFDAPYIVTRPGYGSSDGAQWIAPELAKIECFNLPNCVGFTHEGGSEDHAEPRWIYFKEAATFARAYPEGVIADQGAPSWTSYYVHKHWPSADEWTNVNKTQEYHPAWTRKLKNFPDALK